MRGLNTCFSAAMCGASFYTAETDAKNPMDIYNSIVIAQELTELLWLFQRSRGIRKMKGEKQYQQQKDLLALVTCSGPCPGWTVLLGRSGEVV